MTVSSSWFDSGESCLHQQEAYALCSSLCLYTTASASAKCGALQGALAPFAASAALFAGYLLVKFFPQLNVQAFLNLYFWLIGSIAIFGALQSPLKLAVSPTPCST